MDKKKLIKWLADNDHDRDWLAAQLGNSKGTIDQWFSKGFPDTATKSIERLMNPPGSENGGLEVAFTAREFERIEQARALLGIASRKLYYEEAIAEFTDKILASEAGAKRPKGKNISPFPTDQQSSRAAEDPGNYDSSSGEEPKNGTDH